MRSEHKIYSSKSTKKQQQKKQQTEPRRETQNQRKIHWVIPHEGKPVFVETRIRFSDWTPCHESCPSAARSRVKARQTRTSIKAKQTRISSLLASQGPHVGYVCSTPQIFIMTDLRRSDTTEIRRRLYIPRRKRASPLCRCSRYYEVSQESSV